MKDLAIRLGSAGVGLIFFFLVLFMKPVVLEWAVGFISVGMVYEVMHVFGYKWRSNLLACLCATAMILAINFGGKLAFALAFALTVLMLTVHAILHRKMHFRTIAGPTIMITYIVCCMHFIPLVRSDDAVGVHLFFMLFICAWLSDTGAYFIGKFFGRHKLAEKISPKKTIEGALGGVGFSVAGAIILGLIAQFIFKLQANYLLLALSGMVGSVLGQLGDLFASWIKRQYDIKDFGNIMPGHGGLMDRFDSVLTVAPYIYLLVQLLQKFDLFLIIR